MIDFLIISQRHNKNGTEFYPKFRLYPKSSDLMIRGGDFYAVWIEELGIWSTNEQDALKIIDRELDKAAKEFEERNGVKPKVFHMWDSESGMIDAWHKYCQKQLRDSYHMLDETLIFSNTETTKKDYSSKRLSYPLEQGDISAWDKLISTLYSEEERRKIEWAIGAIVSGDSKEIQKFMVLYGEAGAGKSTILNVIQKLFEGYYCVFDAKALGSNGSQFALEAFRTNPLVAIQHDGDLSKIEDNTRLNSLVSHEEMMVNEKYTKGYANRFKCFLFMGTNKPVKITDGKSGLIRRLIDVSPSGRKLGLREYRQVTKQVNFELGAIAYHCLEVYKSDPNRYTDYMPMAMMGASNDFYNFVMDAFPVFSKEDGVTLKSAWEMYKVYCDDAKISFPLSLKNFKEELKNYFWEYNDRFSSDEGQRVRSFYSGFRYDKFDQILGGPKKEPKKEPKPDLIDFSYTESIFDKECANCFAQYATSKETPSKKWDTVLTKLSELDTSKLHYVKVPENHIVIDFDIPDENGNKCFELNLREASKWPRTYAELSKGGQGIHLHYIYSGDVSKLSRISDDNPYIEIKVSKGNSSLRRRLSKCNNLPIATISSGLPLKGDDKLVNFEAIANEKALRTLIKGNLNKQYHSATKPSIDYIYKNLEDAYKQGLKYDVTDMRNAVLAFAASSTNQADYCIKLVNKMRFKSDEPSAGIDNDDQPLVFYDCEIFPNLFLVNWKFEGEGKPVVRMINPSPADIEDLIRFKLVGFNCRRYDNHMLYARLMGYTNEQLYKLSQLLINKDKKTQNSSMFSEAYNISYTDVYDFTSEKMSLKKWEIELGIKHKELGLPWDQPVPEELWSKVAEYCDADVLATEAVFNARKADFMARKIQVELVKRMHGISDVSVNDTTNSLSAKIIFGKNRKPQNEFNWRDLSQPVGSDRYEEYVQKFGEDYRFRVWNEEGLPEYRDYIPGEVLPEGWSILPFFKGYRYDHGVSTYLGVEVGEGGRVFGVPGIHGNVWDGDIASQHPHSATEEVIFGPRYTKVLKELVVARVAIKHRDFEFASTLLGGVLTPYLKDEFAADLAQALKIVINSIYGLTSAKFDNIFRDKRNVDNIVAKRGSLFMTLLKREVERQGYKVCHIKTDSIKIPDADEFIIDFVTKFGNEYGYKFETEASFDKFCLVNDSVYIAKIKEGKGAGTWTATGKQFAVPYVFKTLFSKEPIEFTDLCETKEVKTAIYLDKNEGLPEGEHNYLFVGRVGSFCPIQPGRGGAELLREAKDKEGNTKYDSVVGAKGYRWLESELVKELGKEDDIDRSYYTKLVDDAVDTISKYGDFEWFVSDDPYISPIKDDTPPWD